MIGKLTDAEIEETLAKAFVGRIGCHADDLTYVIPVSYAYDGKYIYVRAGEGMKVNMMRKNPKVCFQVDQMENMANWRSVIAWGVFEELSDPELRNHALEQLASRIYPLISSETVHLSREWPFKPADMASIKGVVFRILIDQKTGRFENS
ncbi:MAG: pyridoxamine 5'-phosphate oxidase family protein [Chitinophagaceae bacterium]|nr:pyridoxamine 5'-phosphate oxidase family protein [Chitinophagaceae bacterium]